MKRVIKAAYTRKHPALKEGREKLLAAEHDIAYLETCETIEDVRNHEYEVFDVDNWIREMEHASEDEYADIIDEAVDSWSAYVEAEWERYSKFSKKVRLFKEYVSKLKPYIDIKLYDDYAKIYVDDNFTHDDLEALVDTINSVLGSRYFGTGRGGSWTAYTILTPEQVELQVGAIDQVRDCENCIGIQVVGI